MKYIVALDQETTSSRSIIYNERLEIIASAQKEFTQCFPLPSRVARGNDEANPEHRGGAPARRRRVFRRAVRRLAACPWR